MENTKTRRDDILEKERADILQPIMEHLKNAMKFGVNKDNNPCINLNETIELMEAYIKAGQIITPEEVEQSRDFQ